MGHFDDTPYGKLYDGPISAHQQAAIDQMVADEEAFWIAIQKAMIKAFFTTDGEEFKIDGENPSISHFLNEEGMDGVWVDHSGKLWSTHNADLWEHPEIGYWVCCTQYGQVTYHVPYKR